MLTTQNLHLVPLTHEQIKLYKIDQEGLSKNLGINYIEPQQDPSVINEIEEATEFWLKGTLENPDEFQWYTNWHIILKDKQVAIGGIGFAGRPDAEGKVMLGYGLDVRFHGCGYGSEAAAAMVQWAFANKEVKCIVAETPSRNIPSHRVLEKNGFSVSQKTDDTFYWRLDR